MANKILFQDLILYEDEDFIVINKPEGFATLDERQGDLGRSIIQMARKHCPDASPGHRLDKETSGALAIAKHQEAYRHLALQFEDRETQKIYHAVVHGVHDFEDVGVFMPLHITSSGKAKIDKTRGKPSQTIFRTMKAWRNYSLIGAMPISGRLHQIRAHAAYVHAPIVHDPLYGGDPLYLSEIKRNFNLKKGTVEQPLIQRVALHAHKLRFRLKNGEFKEFIAEYPKDFSALTRQLDKWGN